jgi:hypothetical protein
MSGEDSPARQFRPMFGTFAEQFARRWAFQSDNDYPSVQLYILHLTRNETAQCMQPVSRKAPRTHDPFSIHQEVESGEP